MPIEEDFTNTLRAELSSCKPDVLVILSEGVRRGRRRRRQRAALLACVAVLLSGGITGLLLPEPEHPTGAAGEPHTVAVAPATPPPRTPTPRASPPAVSRTTPWAWSSEAVLLRFRALVPAGITVAPGRPPAAGAESFVRYVELDDGRGACWLAISAHQLVKDQLRQQHGYMLTVTSPLPDGTLVHTQQIQHQPGMAPYQVVDALRSDGMDVLMTLSSASYPDRAPVRSAPILSAAQLIAIATSPKWAPGP
ncbi:hypothetical protein ABT288_17175 [Streptomyces sp. NPDC001093]|uniref:hypothetical protein n=1 Tax=Streptomyces sp. NPDC001093 TaxID=3154376 RepID=UPI0033303BEB